MPLLTITYEGKTQKVSVWAKEKGIPVSTLMNRINAMKKPHEVLSQEVRVKTTRSTYETDLLRLKRKGFEHIKECPSCSKVFRSKIRGVCLKCQKENSPQ